MASSARALQEMSEYVTHLEAAAQQALRAVTEAVVAQGQDDVYPSILRAEALLKNALDYQSPKEG